MREIFRHSIDVIAATEEEFTQAGGEVLAHSIDTQEPLYWVCGKTETAGEAVHPPQNHSPQELADIVELRQQLISFIPSSDVHRHSGEWHGSKKDDYMKKHIARWP